MSPTFDSYVLSGDAVQDLAAKKTKGRLLTLPTLELPDWRGVYAVGDCAAIPDPHNPGKFYGPTAQNALRQGEFVADRDRQANSVTAEASSCGRVPDPADSRWTE